MARASRFRNDSMAEWTAAQIQDVSRSELLARLEKVDALIVGIDRSRVFDWRSIAEQIAPEISLQDPDRVITGRDLQHDLRVFVEDVSEALELEAESQTEPIVTIKELTTRWGVSTKTIDRLRDRGLVSRKYRFGRVTRIGFPQSTIDRYEKNFGDRLRRTDVASPKQVRVIQKCAEYLAGQGVSRHEMLSRLRRKFDVSLDGIKLPTPRQPRTESHPKLAPSIVRQFRAGRSVQQLAEKSDYTEETLRRLLRRQLAAELRATDIEFVHHESFEDPAAESEILAAPPDPPKAKSSARAPQGLPPYLASLYEVPLLTREQERYFFRKMNYLKFRAAQLKDQWDSQLPTLKQIRAVCDFLRQATRIKNLLVRRNLRLVVSVARKYRTPQNNFFEMVSDGNLALMRAIDRFDFSRGFKLSTYATWAISNGFARGVPSELAHHERFRTGQDAYFMSSTADGTSEYEQQIVHEGQSKVLRGMLDQLQERDREVLVRRYGLQPETEPQTLEQVGQQFGVSKERIRQLEARALGKLRRIVASESPDIPGI